MVEWITSIGGVAALIWQDESRAIYTHCYGHALNLACGDAVKTCSIISIIKQQLLEAAWKQLYPSYGIAATQIQTLDTCSMVSKAENVGDVD